MTTVFDRLQEFYKNNNVPPLDLLQKCLLGRVIVKSWHSSGNQFKDFLHYKTISEDTGTYKVLAYPDYYALEIDKIIYNWYFPPAVKPRKEPKNRKRIPLK